MTALLLPFPVWMPLCLSCLTVVARTSNTVLNRSGESGHSCPIPDFEGELCCWEFYDESMWNLSGKFYINWNDVIFILFVHVYQVDLQILNHLCIPVLNPTWLWCLSLSISVFGLFIFYWGPLQLYSLVVLECNFICCGVFILFWYQEIWWSYRINLPWMFIFFNILD